MQHIQHRSLQGRRLQRIHQRVQRLQISDGRLQLRLHGLVLGGRQLVRQRGDGRLYLPVQVRLQRFVGGRGIHVPQHILYVA